MAPEEGLLDDWDLLQAPEDPPVVLSGPQNLADHVRLASVMARASIPEGVPEWVTAKFEEEFARKLVGNLRQAGLHGLLKYILEGVNLLDADLQMFMRAMPVEVLRRLVETEVGATASGIHLLAALELAHRVNGERYTMMRLPSGALRLTCWPARLKGESIEFDTTEVYTLPETGHP